MAKLTPLILCNIQNASYHCVQTAQPQLELALRRIYCMIEFSLFLSLAGFEGEVRMLLLTLIVISDMILCFLNFVSFSLDKCHICIIIQYIKFLYIEI